MTWPSLIGDPVALGQEVRRRSRRAALIGLAIAAGIGLLAVAGLLVLHGLVPARPGEWLDLGDAAAVAGYLVVLLALGAAIGLQTVNLILTQHVQQAFGTGSALRRLRRIVLHGEPPTNEEEAIKAAAYALAAAIVIPLQIIAGTLLLAAIDANLLMQLLTLDVGPVLHALQVTLLLILVGTAVALALIQIRSARRSQRYRPSVR